MNFPQIVRRSEGWQMTYHEIKILEIKIIPTKENTTFLSNTKLSSSKWKLHLKRKFRKDKKLYFCNSCHGCHGAEAI